MDILLYPSIQQDTKDINGNRVLIGTSLSFGLNEDGDVIFSDDSYESIKAREVSQFLKILFTEKGSVITNRAEGTLLMPIIRGKTSQATFTSDVSACILDADSQVKKYNSSLKTRNILSNLAGSVKYSSSNLLYADYDTGKVSISLIFSDKSISEVSIVGRIK